MLVTNPWNLTLKELSDYGSNNPDPNIRELARLVGNVGYGYDTRYYEKYDVTVKEFFEDPFEKIRDIEIHYGNIADDNIDLAADKEELQKQVGALKFDLNNDEQQRTITGLKANLQYKNEYIAELRNEIQCRELDIERLKFDLKETEDKLNFWDIMNKKHSY